MPAVPSAFRPERDMIEIRTIEGGDHEEICKKIAQIHAKTLTVGLLPTLGQPFLEGLYRSAARDRSCVLIVAVEDDRAIGFVMGSICPPSFRALRETAVQERSEEHTSE